jgi:RNA polymerase sigma factor (sigma-70 family)
MRRSSSNGRSAESSSGEAAPSPEAALIEREQRQALVAAVDGLPEPQRLVIACRYFLELSEDETAEVLGIRRGTVKSRTARALDRLRETYG